MVESVNTSASSRRVGVQTSVESPEGEGYENSVKVRILPLGIVLKVLKMADNFPALLKTHTVIFIYYGNVKCVLYEFGRFSQNLLPQELD